MGRGEGRVREKGERGGAEGKEGARSLSLNY